MTTQIHRARLRRCLVLAITTWALLLLVGCAERDHLAGPAPHEDGWHNPTGPNGPSCADGERQACWVELGQHGNVVSCFQGERVCADSGWGPCEGSHIVAKSARSLGVPSGAQALAYSTPGDCDNPCDPSCQIWTEDPQGDTTAAGSSTILPGGSIDSLPGGFANKLLKDASHPPAFAPCDGPEDCQADHHCDFGSGQCVPYLPGEFDASCNQPDYTVGVPCDGHVPVCNRGGVVAPAGIKIVFMKGNSSHLQNNFGTCQNFAGNVDKECFTLKPIFPGQCITATDCEPISNGTKAIVVNGLDFQPPLAPECECSNNWSASHKAGGPCAEIAGYALLVHKEEYTAECASGEYVQWGFLSYEAVTPSNGSGSSSVEIEAHTADPPESIHTNCSDCVTLAEVPAAEPESCSLTGPNPCPISLYDALGLPAAQRASLELVFTLQPTPDLQDGPSVHSWQISYSCVPAE